MVLSMLCLLLLLLLQLPDASRSFSTRSMKQKRLGSLMRLHSFSPLKEEEKNAIRHEIEDMRAEALRRIAALEAKLEQAQTEERTKAKEEETPAVVAAVAKPITSTSVFPRDTATTVKPSKVVETKVNNKESSKDVAPRVAIRNKPSPKAAKQKNTMDLLHDTTWRVMLNVGREPGTWMPKDWGASGERLFMDIEVEFTSEQLFDREEFLNGMAGAKVLKVDHVTLGPTMSEGSRPVRFKSTGGWRVAPGEGPMGTDLLRFYVELEEEAHHHTGDVYCPKGRVYCTCGYFPSHEYTGVKDQLERDRKELAETCEDLSRRMESANMWEKIKMGKELLELRSELSRVSDRLDEARVRDPDRALLRLSRKRDIGLTKEGGLCIKVEKGMSVEYHILGKFGIAACEKREHHAEDNEDTTTRRLSP